MKGLASLKTVNEVAELREKKLLMKFLDRRQTKWQKSKYYT